MRTIVDLGIIGTINGVLRPLELPVERDGAAWDLSTDWNAAAVKVYDERTGTEIASPGNVSIMSAADGILRWSPSSNVYANSGNYIARFWLTPTAGGAAEPSGQFRFTIAGL